jgi:hypothetical protein
MFSPSINSIGPRDVCAVAASMVIRIILAPRYTHHECRRNICSRVRLLAYSPWLCEAYGVHPPAASRARHAHTGDRDAPGTPRGTPYLFFQGTSSPVRVSGVPICHVTDPTELPRGAFSKMVTLLYFPRACVALEAL